MAGRILVVDDVATNRIVMKVKLAAACYAVEQAENGADAIRAARESRPDLILLDVMMPDMNGLDVCRALKRDPATADIPIVLITALTDTDAKMDGLEAGADDFLTKPVEEVTLLARVRSLLRARDTVRELEMRDDTVSAMGFAEAATGFTAKQKPGRIALVAPGPRGAVLWKTAINDRLDAEVRIIPREAALAEATATGHAAPDVFVISVDLAQRNEGLRLLSDLRSRPGTRHAASIMILPEGDSERAAIALDLGASDVLHDPFDAKELAIRIGVQLDRKRQSDRMRAGVRAGLEAAVTDPLTGLHNRRYALHRMEQMLAQPRPSLAVMMIDLDHFKSVNDRHGHGAGDAVLCEVANRLRAQLRGGDLLARMGGEEFLVALPGCDADHATECAERLRRAVADRPFNMGPTDGERHVTASIGLVLPHDPPGALSPEGLIDRADRALYHAKDQGRDQVRQATEPASAA
ncbi:diguanylate cyclase domain-containing protein [Hasllibacter sp. MH4015]|uniref:diguanylate cyclase domain-containing protein n=1 Tax=Hasllibacter sp. MH4015 TaxID=2854029 RepID=UPI001CD6BA11|nr:diguanylate cyclase [Hasllibacter sp. MH4015]